MNTTRLLVLADFLETVPKEKFDLTTWRSVGTATDAQLYECGYTACAVGWACVIPALKEQGLLWCSTDKQPRFGDDGGWNAVTSFFDIKYAKAAYLFDGWEYDTDAGSVSDVVARIREMCAKEKL